MFRSKNTDKHGRCAYAENLPAPFPVRQIPARDLRKGMTFAAAPPDVLITIAAGRTVR